MDAAIAAINDTISSKYRNRRLVAGAVVVLHPFSKNMGFNPHLHVLVTEGGFDKKGNFVHQKYINFRTMRKTWQYQVLTRFKANFQMIWYFRCLYINFLKSILKDSMYICQKSPELLTHEK